MRHIPIIAAILVAAVLAPVAASADRMWIGFHDDPVLRYDADKVSDMEVATKTNRTTIVRTLVTWANIAPDEAGECGEPQRPGLQLQRSRRLRAQRTGERRRGSDDGLGNAEVGQRQQDAELPADLDEQLPELHQGAGLTLLRAAPPDCRSFGSTGSGTSRTSASSSRPSSTRAARSSAPRRMRSSPRRATPASRRAAPRRSSRSVRPPRTAVTSRRRARATRFGRARSPRASPRRTRSSSSTRGPITRTRCR